MKKAIIATIVILLVFTGCEQEADRVSYNISQEADNFNVVRQLTVINTNAMFDNPSVLYQMTGNFSIDKESDGDLSIIGENPDGTYYKHLVYLTDDITYIVQQIDGSSVDKYQFTINYNPNLILPAQPGYVD